MGRAVSRGTTLPPLRMSLPSKEASSNKTSSDEFPREGPRTVPPRCGSHALRSPPPSLAQKRALVHPTESTAASLPAQHASKPPSGQPLPGMHGQPLPPLSGRSGIPSALAAAPPSAAQDSHALHLAPAHDTPSMPANRSSTGTLGQPYRECTGSHCRRCLED
jgi:hypothetical protein